MSEKKVTSITSSVRLHRQVHELVRDLALKESRTISNTIALLVKEGLKTRGIEEPAEPEQQPEEVPA